jgi:hypothetical protein
MEAVVEEARVKGDTTLFLDYLGVHLQQRTPILIFEAKAWDKPPVSAISSANRRDAPELLLAKALTFIRDGQGVSPVTAEWTGWLSKLRDYVRDLQSQSRHVVSKVAISSGQWLVIFTDTRNAFIDDGTIDPNFILVFKTDQFVANSDDIFKQLAYDTLVKSIPSPLRPTQLSAYIAASDVRRVFHTVVVTWQASGSDAVFDRFPQIIVNPAAVVERADGALLHVTDHLLGHDFVPTDPDKLEDHFAGVRARADRLLGSIADALGTKPVASDIDVFRGFPEMPTRGSSSGLVPEPMPTRVSFLWRFPDSPREFLLVTGTSPHFLLDNPSFGSCTGHSWTACSTAGHAQGGNPVLASSIQRLTFGLAWCSTARIAQCMIGERTGAMWVFLRHFSAARRASFRTRAGRSLTRQRSLAASRNLLMRRLRCLQAPSWNNRFEPAPKYAWTSQRIVQTRRFPSNGMSRAAW